jgi:hypothetical protein
MGLVEDDKRTTMHRRFKLLFLFTAAVSIATTVVVACTPAGPTTTPLDARDDEDAGKRTNPPRAPGPKPEEDPILPDGGKPPGRVYAHTRDELFLFDPLAKTLTRIGQFGCLDSGDRVLDIALDRDGVMYGTTDDGFLKIDALDATCEYVKRDAIVRYPNSLAFVPAGTVDDTKETLVGYQYDPAATNQATVYVQISLTTGAVAKVGDLNPAGAAVKYKSSGDFIALIRNGNKAFLTVKTIDPDAGSGNDLLAEIDPSSGQIKQILGDTQKKNLYGFGQWAGTGYGFSDTGEILEVDMATGAAATLLTLDAGTRSWFGAGVTTDSPTKP